MGFYANPSEEKEKDGKGLVELPLSICKGKALPLSFHSIPTFTVRQALGCRFPLYPLPPAPGRNVSSHGTSPLGMVFLFSIGFLISLSIPAKPDANEGNLTHLCMCRVSSALFPRIISFLLLGLAGRMTTISSIKSESF